MEPIVSPWIVYIISVSNAIKVIAIVATITSGLFVTFQGLMGSVYFDGKEYIKKMKIGVLVLIVSILLTVFIPGKETLLTMLVFSYVTPDNIQLVQNDIIDFIQKIMTGVSQNGK